MPKFINDYGKYVSLIVASSAVLGSLFFSQVMLFAPCVLCWYQRIAMFPLVPVLMVGLIRKDKELPYYVLPLSIGGLITAAYHSFIYYNLIVETQSTCAFGVSCSERYFELFGFLSIPVLSLMAFSIITVLSAAELTLNNSLRSSEAPEKSLM
jgi:disulfide bond formation protein DsbB